MTFGQLFTLMHPDIKIKENRTCVWLYFDESNHYTFGSDWWNAEIDVLPDIVRCGDCAHWCELKDSDPSRGVCKIWHTLHHSDWFCRDGERKED